MTNLRSAAAQQPGCGAAAPERQPRPLTLAIAGYGVVGQALVARLAASPRFDILSILVRDPDRARDVPPPCPLTADRRQFLAGEPDVLVDVLSCAQTGALLSEWALARGIHLVSASKRVVAGCYPTLARCAEGSGARFLYSAAVGGETPILETVAAAAAEREIASVTGILNGTVNYILSGIAQGRSFAEALAAARRAGFAEEDPAEDLSGADALAKLRLIAAAAFGGSPGDYDFDAEPLDDAAARRIERSGERWLQVAHVERRGGRIRGSVSLQLRAKAPPLPPADAEWNCAVVTTADGFSRTCLGRGAGGAPTASALAADLAQLSARAAAFA